MSLPSGPAHRFAEHCTMAAGRFDGGCAEEQMRGAGGIDVGAVSACMGDLDRDTRDDLLQVRDYCQQLGPVCGSGLPYPPGLPFAVGERVVPAASVCACLAVWRAAVDTIC